MIKYIIGCDYMKTEKNIFVAFLLNMAFSITEFLGGIMTNSVAILSDSIHDLGDAISIGISYFLEKKSKKGADNKYTYGYLRYSVLGGVITTTILLVGSILVIVGAIRRIITPVSVNYYGMIWLAVFGVIINFFAAYITREGDSINQKSVNLHMLEDVLGWVVVLIGAIVMHFTNIGVIDPIMSIGVALFILYQALKNLKRILDIFLEKTPNGIDIEKLKNHLLEIEEVEDIHHIHVWSIDGHMNYATMHIVSKSDNIKEIKKKIREELEKYHIDHSILETEEEYCGEENCHVEIHPEHFHNH